MLVPGRGTSASIPITRISRRTRLRLSHSPRAVERKFEMQFVDAAHHRQIVRPGDGIGGYDSSPSRHGPRDPIGPMADPEISRFPRKERPNPVPLSLRNT